MTTSWWHLIAPDGTEQFIATEGDQRPADCGIDEDFYASCEKLAGEPGEFDRIVNGRRLKDKGREAEALSRARWSRMSRADLVAEIEALIDAKIAAAIAALGLGAKK